MPEKSSATVALWLFLSAVAQLSFGFYPGLMRFLQTDSNFGPFAVLTMLSGVNIVLLGVPLLLSGSCHSLRTLKKVLVFAFLQNGAHITAVYAVVFTRATIFQMIGLSIPFITAFFNRFINREPLPRYTISAMVVSTFGAFLMLFGDIVFSDLTLSLREMFGYLLSLGAALSVSGYYIYITYSRGDVSGPLLAWLQFPLIFPICASLTITLETWPQPTSLSPTDWIVLASLIVLVFILGNVLQVVCTQKLGAPLTATLLPLRLIGAVGLGQSPLLKEDLGTLDFVGIFIVLSTLSVFLFLQYLGASSQRSKGITLKEPLQVNAFRGR